MRTPLAALLVIASTVHAAPTFTQKPTARKVEGEVRIAFTISEGTDVEVAILDAKGKVIRHLAAGVLGGKTAPPAPLKAGFSQSIEWDGKDDYGEQAAQGGPPAAAKPLGEAGFSVRVRVGMGVKLERIVGGDPVVSENSVGQKLQRRGRRWLPARWTIEEKEVSLTPLGPVKGGQREEGARRQIRCDSDWRCGVWFTPPSGMT